MLSVGCFPRIRRFPIGERADEQKDPPNRPPDRHHAILLEAALSFLGVGIPPPTPSWGEMLRTGKDYLHDSPTYAVLPGLALTFTILSFDTLGRTISRCIGEGSRGGPLKAAGQP